MSCHLQGALLTVDQVPSEYRHRQHRRHTVPSAFFVALLIAGRAHGWLAGRAASASADSLVHTSPQRHNCLMTKELGLQDLGTSRNASSFSISSNSSGGTVKSGGTSKGSGARALHHNRSSMEWHRGSGSLSGSTVESGLALFAGKKVLLVEVCDMVSELLVCVCVCVCLCLCLCLCLCMCEACWELQSVTQCVCSSFKL